LPLALGQTSGNRDSTVSVSEGIRAKYAPDCLA
jgi:hypothetical protein